jgi:hypothetical protein
VYETSRLGSPGLADGLWTFVCKPLDGCPLDEAVNRNACFGKLQFVPSQVCASDRIPNPKCAERLEELKRARLNERQLRATGIPVNERHLICQLTLSNQRLLQTQFH